MLFIETATGLSNLRGPRHAVMEAIPVDAQVGPACLRAGQPASRACPAALGASICPLGRSSPLAPAPAPAAPTRAAPATPADRLPTPLRARLPFPQAAARAPLVFKREVDQVTSDWAQHHAKRLIDTQAKGLRGSIPPNFPYFYVQFGYSAGFVHPIDDEQKFPANFGKQVSGRRGRGLRGRGLRGRGLGLGRGLALGLELELGGRPPARACCAAAARVQQAARRLAQWR